MSKTTQKPERHVPQVPSQFYNWWKEHRHSGFAENEAGMRRWGITPLEAWKCNRYRTEFSADTGTPYAPPEVEGAKLTYEMEDIERWAKEQKEAVAYGRVATREEFLVELRTAITLLAKKFAQQKMEADSDQKQLSETDVFSQLNALQKAQKGT